MAELPRSDVAAGPPGPGSVAQATTQREETGRSYPTAVEDGFSGWAWFAGVLMGLVGLFQIMISLFALASTHKDVPARSLLIHVSYDTWGWVHLALGVVMLAAGGGLVFGSMVARVAGVAVAVISAVVNLAFLRASPFAATMIIALDVFVIFAITVHGGEPKKSQWWRQ